MGQGIHGKINYIPLSLSFPIFIWMWETVKKVILHSLFQTVRMLTTHGPNTSSTHPKNCILDGPKEMIRLARPSPSTSGGGVVSFWGFTRRQVMRVGAAQVRGGMITRKPWCLLPRMEPPRASTIKLTRNLSIVGWVKWNGTDWSV